MKLTHIGRVTVQPIRDDNDLINCINYFKGNWKRSTGKSVYIHYRNYMLFLFGINTALRVSDILKIKVNNVKDGYIVIREKKTGKLNQISINKKLFNELQKYINFLKLDVDDFLFYTQKGVNKPTTRINVYNMLNSMKDNLKINYPIGAHTMRKTFGYHYYKQTNNIVALQKMLNHRDSQITLIYIGMAQKTVDDERKKFYLGGS